MSLQDFLNLVSLLFLVGDPCAATCIDQRMKYQAEKKLLRRFYMLKTTLSVVRGYITGGFVAMLAMSLCTLPVSASGRDDDDDERELGFCSKTAELVLKACNAEMKDDYWIARANCLNISEAGVRRDCVKGAAQERNEGLDLCEEQLDARLELCDNLGEDRVR